jgi:CRISPR-associated protein Csb1
MSLKELLDGWIREGGPAALVIREPLMPVEGPDGVLFPATFAKGDGFAGGYNIDGDPNGENVCLIDSVGSQANRLEPLFKEPPYASLVPQIVVRAGAHLVNLLEVGHRAGDALVRCSTLQSELQNAFLAVNKGDAEPLAKLAPTSLVFGVWDSRDTQAKCPRLIASTIRAFHVRSLKRGAVYIPPIDYASLEVLSAEEKARAEGDAKNPLAQRGFVHVPASGSHGGVIATGGIQRQATLGLAALRLLAAADPDRTTRLRRYILGLALVAFTTPPVSYLRQGCLLVLNPHLPREFSEVHPDGRRVPCSLTHEQALEYAQAAAQEFGVGASRTVDFDKERAKQDVSGKDHPKTKPKKGKKGKEALSQATPAGEP